MPAESDAPLTPEEMRELLGLEIRFRGLESAQANRRRRERLRELRAGRAIESTLPSWADMPGSRLEARLAALEAEVKRLKNLIEPYHG